MSEATTAAAKKFPSAPIVIECVAPKNRQLVLKHYQIKLRSRWSNSALGGRALSDRLAGMPDLPGMQLALNCNQKTLIIEDPLSRDDDQTKTLLEQANAIVEDIFGAGRKPTPKVTHTDLSDDDIHSLLHEFARWNETGKIAIIKGTVPKVAEVKQMPGRRRINHFDSHPQAPRFEGQPDKRLTPEQQGVS